MTRTDDRRLFRGGRSRRPLGRWAPAGFCPGEGKRWCRGPKDGGGVEFLWRGCEPPPHQLGPSGERCKLPQQGPERSPGANRFLYNFWPLDDYWRLRFLPLMISCVYGKIWGQFTSAFQSQIWGRVRRLLVLLQNTSTSYNTNSFIVYRNEIVAWCWRTIHDLSTW